MSKYFVSSQTVCLGCVLRLSFRFILALQSVGFPPKLCMHCLLRLIAFLVLCNLAVHDLHDPTRPLLQIYFLVLGPHYVAV